MIKFILLTLVSGLVFFYFYQDALLFFPRSLSDEQRRRFHEHEVTFERDGVRLHGWFVRGAAVGQQPLLVYYGGNAEEVSYNLWELERFPTRTLLFVNYRGYGDSTGKPSQMALYEDALYVLDTVLEREGIPSRQVVLMGRSLGAAVAVYVASQRAVRGVILVAPFDRLLHIAQHHYPWLPARYLLKHSFDSLALAPTIQTPALFLLGRRDRIIPNRFSLNLRAQWGGPARTVVIERAGHNDISGFPDYWQAIAEFFATLTQERAD